MENKLSMAIYLTLFLAGTITILLPCILPLLPIVLGVSIAGRNKFRPLTIITGMLISFVSFTFLLQVVLSQFVQFADLIQITTYYILLIFGVCFFTTNKNVQLIVAVLGGYFYYKYGWIVISVAEVGGWLAIEIGGRVASRIQQLGSNVQQAARSGLGSESLVTAFVVGLTLGLVWVPCAGPALGFALALVRNEPGLRAFAALFAYGLGASVPLLIIGYGGQAAVHSARAITQYSGRIKQVSGAILMVSAVAFQYGYFTQAQTWLAEHVPFGDFGSRLEDRLFAPPQTSSSSEATQPTQPTSPTQPRIGGTSSVPSVASESSVTSPSPAMPLPKLPKLIRAPEFTGLGPWHNSAPFTLASLKGKVVLVDFWTYSCINCIRTLPYMEGYWKKFKDMPFVLLGVHTPEFVFEKDEGNVSAAIKAHGLTYPVAQDNNFGTWNAFANRYWPAKYLIDAEGYIRYTHFGEGGYEETDLAIQSLLAELGQTSTGPLIGADQKPATRGRDVSPETYVGERSWPSFSNALGSPDDQIHTYVMPANVPLNQYALSGDWKLVNGEYQVTRSHETEIRYHALGSEVNLVVGLASGVEKVLADVIVDGEPLNERGHPLDLGAHSHSIVINRHDLYRLFDGPYGEHDILLKIHGKGAEAYAYTFGG